MAKRRVCTKTYRRTDRKISKRTHRTIRYSKKNSHGLRNYFPRRNLQTTLPRTFFCDHGNGKVERLIRTINKRIRADKSIITERGKTGLARLLFALRTAAAANKNSPFEQVFGRKPNTVKEIKTEKPNNCLENDNTLKFSPDESPNSTIFFRERTKNIKLEGQLKKKSGTIVAESDHTVTLETKRGRQVISKRDIAKKKSASHSPKTNTKTRNSHSLERKIVALKDAEERSEKELNKPL